MKSRHGNKENNTIVLLKEQHFHAKIKICSDFISAKEWLKLIL